MVSWEPGLRRGAYTRVSAAALSRFLDDVLRALKLRGEVDVLLASDATIAAMNTRFRRKNIATDVLSFPTSEDSAGIAGDLAISVDTAARQAAEQGHALVTELKILLLHGAMHLAGFDHEVDNGDMRRKETALRKKFGLPGGLIERAQKVRA